MDYELRLSLDHLRYLAKRGEKSMGQFSWITCDTKEQVVNNEIKDVYVLVPKEFGKENIL